MYLFLKELLDVVRQWIVGSPHDHEAIEIVLVDSTAVIFKNLASGDHHLIIENRDLSAVTSYDGRQGADLTDQELEPILGVPAE